MINKRLLFLLAIFTLTAIAAKADDTPKLRRIIEAAVTNHTDAVIGPGTFSIQPQGDEGPMLPITSNMIVRCVSGTVLRIADNALVGGKPGVVFGGYTKDALGVKLTNVIIDGCTIDGNYRRNQDLGSSHHPYTPPAIQFERSSGIIVRNMHFVDLTYGAIWFFNVQKSAITDNDIFGSSQHKSHLADAIQLNGVNQVVVSNNHMTNIGEGIFAQHSTGIPQEAAQNVAIANNTLENLPANGGCEGRNVPFDCCTANQQGSGTGLCAAGRSYGSSIGVLAQDTLVLGNTLRNASQISVQAGRGFETLHVAIVGNESTRSNANCLLLITLDPPSGMEKIRLAANSCRDFEANGIHVKNSSDVSVTGHIEIDGNVFESVCGRNCVAPLFIDGPVRRIREISITGNRFLGALSPQKPPVVFNGFQEIVFRGNLRTQTSVPSIGFQKPFWIGSLLWEANWPLRYDELMLLQSRDAAADSNAYCSDCQRTNRCAPGGNGAFARYHTIAGPHWQCD